MTGLAEVFAGKRVLVTGHTGFKGSWATLWLSRLGAEVWGLSLPPEASPNLFDLMPPLPGERSFLRDIRDPDAVAEVVTRCRPDIVLHLAAQPLVRRSYRRPVETFDANVMGTIHLLDSLRSTPECRVALMVTTDKVYRNGEGAQRFGEDDPLGGHDPYSASKAAAELVIESYRSSYFSAGSTMVASARGGNVIGGGDFSEDRLVPDIVRALVADRRPSIRNPASTRPWQHVLDCLGGYLHYIAALATRPNPPKALNIGPRSDQREMPVGEVVRAMLRALGRPADWLEEPTSTLPEMATLSLDPSRAAATIGWSAVWDFATAIELTAKWYQTWNEGGDVVSLMHRQIEAYEGSASAHDR